MNVHITKASSIELRRIDHMKNFAVGGELCHGQVLKGSQDHSPLAKMTKRDFADDKRMDDNARPVEERLQIPVAYTEMIDPDRRID
jgi:hypothetical protein